MKLWVPSSEISDLSLVGGKGLHLQKLTRWGAEVPEFFVLTTHCYRQFTSRREISSELDSKFKEFFSHHPVIALRSSMIAEDQQDSSFAGLFETKLDVNASNWKEALLHIYRTVISARVQEYVERKNLSIDLQMAVVAQAQVNVEKSGVLFTRSPVAPTSAMAIDAAFGMGEGVVSGHSQVDHYQLTRRGEIILQLKNNPLSVLDAREIEELIKTSLHLESEIGLPSDIEWGFKESKLYIFQIRPITREFEPLTYFIDTNLSESYPGTVSPFTAAFVRKAYENVFRESAELLGAKDKRLETLNNHYRKLISCVDDHLYYNLEHYYAVLRALPGGEKNIISWHKMIGGKLTGDEVPRHSTELTYAENLQTLFSMGKLALKHQQVFSELLKRLEIKRDEIVLTHSKLETSDQIITQLSKLTGEPLGFGLTVINDVFIMMGLSVLTKAFKKKGIDEENVIDVLKTSEGVDSLKPLEYFDNLVKRVPERFIKQFDGLAQEPGFEPYKEIFSTLKEMGFQDEVTLVEQFLHLYGDRSFEELKLESLPLRNNPRLFVDLLKWAKINPSLVKKSHSQDLKLDLSWKEKKFLKFTRECIATREATRLWRGKFYHLLRMLILQLGHQLKVEDARWNEFSVLDFFSLNHDEWLMFKNGDLRFEQVRNLILTRRPWISKRQQYPEMIIWVASENLPTLGMGVANSEISGQGVSPGIAEGVALVLENPNEALVSDLKDFILVTKNTDPAWVYIMSRSLGLISEKGSLLSHTAIIGRELSIPTIVGVRSATYKIKTGDKIRMDATTGKIVIL